MGLFDRLFSNTKVEQQEIETPVSLTNVIETILLIMENLSLMKKDVIRQRISDEEYFDDSILEKLPITMPTNLEYLEKYYGNVKFGYGINKISQIREKLNNFVAEKLIEGKPEEEIISEILMIVESDIIIL